MGPVKDWDGWTYRGGCGEHAIDLELCVCLSVRSNFCTSTDRPKWCRKSAPKIACITSATMKIHWKGWRRPRFNVSERVPNVTMEDWLTACREYLLARCVCGGPEGGITLTSVSV